MPKRHKQRMLVQLFTASSKGKGNSTSLRIRYTTAWNEATQRDRNTIRKQLHDLKEGESITFGELLVKLNISESDYRLAVRSALNSPTVFFFLNENQMN